MSLFWDIVWFIVPLTPIMLMWGMILILQRRKRAKISPLNRQKINQVKRDIKTIKKSHKGHYGSQSTIEDVLNYMQARHYFFDGHADFGKEERTYYFTAPTFNEGKNIVIRVYWNKRYLILGQVYGTVEDVDRPTIGITEYSNPNSKNEESKK